MIRIDESHDLLVELSTKDNTIDTTKVVLCSPLYDINFKLKEKKTNQKPKTHGISFLEQ